MAEVSLREKANSTALPRYMRELIVRELAAGEPPEEWQRGMAERIAELEAQVKKYA